MRKILLPLLALAMGACVPVPSPDTATRTAISFQDTSGLPTMKSFSHPRPTAPRVSNTDLARDFIDLSFLLESGRLLPAFTRFEGPITIRLAGTPPPSLRMDLNRLVHRLRTEAQIDIRQTSEPRANLSVVAIPRAEIRRHLPQAACFVVPNVSSFDEYLGARRNGQVSWSTVTVRQRVAVFLPSDAAPQEVRDCLHEEIAQALGPLNDMYRLADSVFNDDNIHTVLTGYDMMVLRAYYDPSLRSGMSRADVMARLPAILSRVNPQGTSIAPQRLGHTPRPWLEAVQTALGPGASPGQRRAAAQKAVSIATTLGWTDHRRGFSHYALGRILQGVSASAAKDQFALAQRYFSAAPNTELHQAYVASQLAAYAINAGQANEALSLIGRHLDTAQRHENAALLSTLMMLRAEAMELSGRAAEGRQVRLDSLGWARYGFGSDWAVRAKLREIASLNPVKGG
ncbi:hypothetical protein GCM10011415_04180 [Salipiger pallidus]|uniref:ATP-dependent transcriptional regulator n=1 Tax=Salipiger pallidus TaxID=1775170 RepID=A0A8J3EF34_9RHOB|nr:DUF2927 domain-containing protein [Salipiger pallidus]GGG61276.1 hypothetical protein GCM10011415_04180 [Salipiger pallidus]